MDADLATLREIEHAAGRLFAEIGMPEIAEDEPPSIAALRGFLPDGCWVCDDGAGLAGYLLTMAVDGCAHVEQVSVRPECRGLRIGSGLIEHLARRTGVPLTLTTFAEVPWNAPYYERLGFRRLAVEEETPGLRAIRAREFEQGLDRWPRLCMRREAVAKEDRGEPQVRSPR